MAQKAVEHKPTNTYAIISLVSSVAGFFGFAFIGPILGIVFGQMAKKQITETKEEGLGLARAGVILGIIQLALVGLVIIGLFAFIIIAAVVAS